MLWQTSRFTIDLTEPKVMGIVNVTPDSFSDGGHHTSVGAALQHCEKLLRDGADILDIGGESSRPAATPLSLDDELARVLPVVREAVKLGVPISVDTYKPQVMQAVLDLGADIINDIWGLQWRGAGQPGQHNNQRQQRDEGDAKPPPALQIVSQHPRCGVCVMHMHRDPQTMQVSPMSGDVVQQVLQFWGHVMPQIKTLIVDLNRIVLDPGIGFGKTVVQNFELLARQRELLAAGRPLLLGWSRKSSLALAASAACGLPGMRLATLDGQDLVVRSVAAAVLAVERGASIVRVHDVRETVQALKVCSGASAASPASAAGVMAVFVQ